MRSDLPTGTVTFLFTDVEGSTSLLRELGAEAYADALAEHRRVVREACAAEGGVEVDTQGDAFFVAFPSAPGAAAAAQAITDALAPGPISLRIGCTRAPRSSPTRATSETTCTSLPVSQPRATEVRSCSRSRLASSSRSSRSATSGNTGSRTSRAPFRSFSWARRRSLHSRRSRTPTSPGQRAPSSVASESGKRLCASSVPERAYSRLPGQAARARRALLWKRRQSSSRPSRPVSSGSDSPPSASPRSCSQTIAQTLGARDGLAEHIGERELLLLLDNLEQVIEAAPELSGLLRVLPEP